MDATSILSTLCKTPSVSYFERGTASLLTGLGELLGLDVAHDVWGNVYVVPQGIEFDDVEVAFVAHMDHPGFEVVEAVSSRDYRMVSHGGMPRAAFEPGVQVEVVRSMDADFPWERISGVITGADDIEERSRFATCSTVWVETSEPLEVLPSPAVLALPDFVDDGEFLRARSLDDLAGCAAIAYALYDTSQLKAPCIGIFTRAEEIGLVGARLIAGSGMLPDECLVVSVETSLTHPLAKQGDGVVIRVGDIITTFDNHAETLLRASTRMMTTGKVQRALMSAGGCEASAFAAHGYLVTGTSLPLGAWHNQEEDGSLAMEYVAKSDFDSCVELLTNAIRLSAAEAEEPGVSPLAGYPEAEGERLAEDAAEWLSAKE